MKLTILSTLCAAACGAALLVLYARYRRLARHAARMRRARKLQLQLRVAHVEALRAAQRRHWLHLQDVSIPILVTEPRGSILAANPAALEMLGYESEAQLQALKADALYADQRYRNEEIVPQLEEHGMIRNAEVKFRRRDGALIDVLLSVRTVDSPERGRTYEAICNDITELRRAAEANRSLQAQLHLSQKLEAVGQLAAGIAHEINTPIQFVSHNAYFLRDAFRDLASVLGQCRPTTAAANIDEARVDRLLSEIPQVLEESFDGLNRVTETVRAMKEFAHPDDGEKAAADLNQAIQTTIIVARNEYKQVADVKTEFGDIPPVYCRKGEINKVILNLIVNAAHAIEQGRRDGGGRGVISIRTAIDGPQVAITVADTGCGISPAVLTRIFDPFFTTKPVGKGTGQGLAIARSIIVSHGGRIDVESALRRGTTFTIRLPIGEGDTQDPSLFDITQSSHAR